MALSCLDAQAGSYRARHHGESRYRESRSRASRNELLGQALSYCSECPEFLENASKVFLRREGHGSISVQEGQPSFSICYETIAIGALCRSNPRVTPPNENHSLDDEW